VNDQETTIDKHVGRAKVVISAIGVAVTVGLALATLVDSVQRDISGIHADLAAVEQRLNTCASEQEPGRLCHRIATCTTATAGSISDLRSAIAEARSTLQERGERISNLEAAVYNLTKKPTARPDPFTGTMGRELEARIKALEGK
jgi:hypothetical protein